jgi:hypothetical protein
VKQLIALTILLFSSSSFAQWLDGNQLMERLREWEAVTERSTADADLFFGTGMYIGYVLAVWDAEASRDRVCSSGNLGANQIGAVVSKFLKAHPERWSESALTLVGEALVTAFPCNR